MAYVGWLRFIRPGLDPGHWIKHDIRHEYPDVVWQQLELVCIDDRDAERCVLPEGVLPIEPPPKKGRKKK